VSDYTEKHIIASGGHVQTKSTRCNGRLKIKEKVQIFAHECANEQDWGRTTA
jgi:hypothetical protein